MPNDQPVDLGALERWAQAEANLTAYEPHWPSLDDERRREIGRQVLALIQRMREAEAPIKGIDMRVLRKAYDWTVDVNGEVCGLTAGDQCFEPVGIRIPVTELDDFGADKVWIDRYRGQAVKDAAALARTQQEAEIARLTERVRELEHIAAGQQLLLKRG